MQDFKALDSWTIILRTLKKLFFKVPAFQLYISKKEFKISCSEKLKYLRSLLSDNTFWKNLKVFVCLLFTFSYILKNSKNIVFCTYCLSFLIILRIKQLS